MPVVDLKKELSTFYNPSAREVSVVDVPPMDFLMVAGQGDPNTAPAYAAAVEALYTLSYTLKFMVRRGADGVDYGVMPLEGLWWAEGPEPFDVNNRAAWRWTMMIMQPAYVTAAMVEEATAEVRRKKRLAALDLMRYERFAEGRAAQILHIGPFSAEGPTVQRLHDFIAAQGQPLSGKHHEIYLADPRRTAPEKLRTIIRQPFG